MKQDKYLNHLSNIDYTKASELWYDSELVLKNCVEHGDENGALEALDRLIDAVNQRFQPILNGQKMQEALFGILGGILHFACRDGGLPPSYLTMIILWQGQTLYDSVKENNKDVYKAMQKCVSYACELVNQFSMPHYNQLIKKCIITIHNQLTENINIDDLAHYLSVSRQYLSTVFHQETGVTIVEYINLERIKLSKYYLKNSQLSITKIAFMCGYSDSNYYSRVFKKYENMTPKQYRNNLL